MIDLLEFLEVQWNAGDIFTVKKTAFE